MMAKKQRAVKAIEDAKAADAIADALETQALAAREAAEAAEAAVLPAAISDAEDDPHTVKILDKDGTILALAPRLPELLPFTPSNPTEEALLKRTTELAAIRKARNPVDDFDAALFARLASS